MVKLPVILGVIDRRILVNYQVNPDALRRILPRPLEPKIVDSVGIAGICLIRLREIRPRWLPRALGVRSENAAHRIAVQLPDGREGVYVPRRDTSSRLNAIVGGRLFPGTHHRARFAVREGGGRYRVRIDDRRGSHLLGVEARRVEHMPATSLFASIEETSAFFEAGSLGYSPSNRAGKLDGLLLKTHSWQVSPLKVEQVHSAFFQDLERFPEGTVRFDSALLMKDIHHEWLAQEPLYCGEARTKR